MAKIYRLYDKYKGFLYISYSDLERILLISYGICQAKTVNMSSVSSEISSTDSGKKESGQYKWLLSAFQTGNTVPIFRQIFGLLVGMFSSGLHHEYILIDRTNWDIGLRRVNILSIGFLHRNSVYIPLLHEDLGYKGNSDGETRLNLIKQLIEWWRLLNIPLPTFEIVGDREFIGEDWLYALEQLGVSYVIRLKSSLQFYEWIAQEGMSFYKSKVKDIMARHHKGGKYHAEIVLKEEVIVNITSTRNDGKDKAIEKYIYLITNRKDIEQAANIYKKRWKIETCFKHLKSAGFNLEDLNMEFPHKTDILMSILSLVYAITIWLAQEEELQEGHCKMQTYANGKTYRRKSLFAIGKEKIVKVKLWTDFTKLCAQICENAIHNLILFNKIHIINKYG
jgi:Transposase DDE domain